jgi:small subunit ribosomal protein S17
MSEKKAKIFRQFTGEVVSTKMQKTIVVKVERTVEHKVYKKLYKVTTNYKVHDEKNVAKEGDKVVFQECRPLSKDKRWRLVKVQDKK